MKTIKATFITVTKQYKTAEVPDDIAKSNTELRSYMCDQFIEFSADNEETVNTSLAVLEDITPPEEHDPEKYAIWYVESGAVYFRSNKTLKDYQIMRLTSAGEDHNTCNMFAIVEMLDEPHGLRSYGHIIDTFCYVTATSNYEPGYVPNMNGYIQNAIQKYENGVADEQ